MKRSHKNGKLLASGPENVRIVECPCGKHVHLGISNVDVKLDRREFLELARSVGRASRELRGESPMLGLDDLTEFWPN